MNNVILILICLFVFSCKQAAMNMYEVKQLRPLFSFVPVSEENDMSGASCQVKVISSSYFQILTEIRKIYNVKEYFIYDENDQIIYDLSGTYCKGGNVYYFPQNIVPTNIDKISDITQSLNEWKRLKNKLGEEFLIKMKCTPLFLTKFKFKENSFYKTVSYEKSEGFIKLQTPALRRVQ